MNLSAESSLGIDKGNTKNTYLIVRTKCTKSYAEKNAPKDLPNQGVVAPGGQPATFDGLDCIRHEGFELEPTVSQKDFTYQHYV